MVFQTKGLKAGPQACPHDLMCIPFAASRPWTNLAGLKIDFAGQLSPVIKLCDHEQLILDQGCISINVRFRVSCYDANSCILLLLWCIVSVGEKGVESQQAFKVVCRLGFAHVCTQ